MINISKATDNSWLYTASLINAQEISYIIYEISKQRFWFMLVLVLKVKRIARDDIHQVFRNRVLPLMEVDG